MKIIILSLFIFGASSLFAPAFAQIEYYFDSFYSNYLEERKIPCSKREVLNLLHEISKNKVVALEEFLNSANSKNDIEEAIYLINDEYYDFLENLNFEASFSEGSPIKKRAKNKFKKAHRKFMRQLKKRYLNCY